MTSVFSWQNSISLCPVFLFIFYLFIFLGSNTSLLIKIGTITINTFLSTRNKFFYSCGVKTCALGFNELLESIFCLLLVVEAFSLEKVVEMLEEVVVSWQEVR